MRKIVVGLSLIGSMVFLEGCLSEGEFTCSNENALVQYEFFLLSDNEGYYFSQTEEAEFDNFRLCEEILPDAALGVNNIYAINGKLVDQCDDGICIRVDEYVLPYCPVTYENNGGSFGVIGSWKLANFYAGNFNVHPSCNYSDISWTFEFVDDSPNDIVGGTNLGSNNLSTLLTPINDSLMVVNNLTVGTQTAVPYVAYFEQEVVDFLEAQDTIQYTINGSEMIFSSTVTDSGLRFFKP